MAKKRRNGHPAYKRPYLDSSVFIAWIKGEKVVDAKNKREVDRGEIGKHILTQAEKGDFPIVISALTLAEVQKKKGKPKLVGDQNKNLLRFFENDFVIVQSVDREIGEQANRLCRKHESKKLMPNDAIHIACAKRAGCDVLLAWDEPLLSVRERNLRIEAPRKLGQFALFDEATERERVKEKTKSKAKP